jgi:hypothetical protein
MLIHKKKNIQIEYTPEQFRNNRLGLVSESDIFIFLYDETALYVSGSLELGYSIAQNELTNKNTNNVVILMNTMSTTLLKMLPNTTYIQIDDSYDLNEEHFPDLIKLSSLDELPNTFKDILEKE